MVCASRDDSCFHFQHINFCLDTMIFRSSPAQYSNSVSKHEVCRYITDLLKFYLNGATTKRISRWRNEAFFFSLSFYNWTCIVINRTETNRRLLETCFQAERRVIKNDEKSIGIKSTHRGNYYNAVSLGKRQRWKMQNINDNKCKTC